MIADGCHVSDRLAGRTHCLEPVEPLPAREGFRPDVELIDDEAMLVQIRRQRTFQ